MGRASLTAVPFCPGQGAAVLVNGRDDGVVPLGSSEEGAKAFATYCRLRGNKLDRLIRLSQQRRKKVGRPLAGPAGAAPFTCREGKLSTAAPRTEEGTPAPQGKAAAEQGGAMAEDNYWGPNSVPPRGTNSVNSLRRRDLPSSSPPAPTLEIRAESTRIWPPWWRPSAPRGSAPASAEGRL